MKRIFAWFRGGFLVQGGMMRSHDPAFMLGKAPLGGGKTGLNPTHRGKSGVKRSVLDLRTWDSHRRGD